MTGTGDPVSETRPPSPFLILLLGTATTVLAAEWLRFGWGPWLAAGPAMAGAAITILTVARAVHRRRQWRAQREAERFRSLRPEEHTGTPAHDRPPSDTELSLRRGDGAGALRAAVRPQARRPRSGERRSLDPESGPRDARPPAEPTDGSTTATDPADPPPTQRRKSSVR